MHFVYILRSQKESRRLYIGRTENLEKRLKEHCIRSGSVHTRKQTSVELIYHETFRTGSQALERERQPKG